MEQDEWDEDFEGMRNGADWDENHGYGEEAAEDWDFYAFQQSSSNFAPCITQYCKDKNISHTLSTERCYKLHPSKGKGASPKGRNSLLFTKGFIGKGKSKGKSKGKPSKGKGNHKGKDMKGKAAKGLGRSLDDTCHFCKQPEHYKAQCSKYAALSTSTGYGRIRAKLPNEKVYVYDLLEDSVDSGVCANCLSNDCDWTTCAPPMEAYMFQEASKSFIEDGMWDMVSEAKASNPPLSKELFMRTHETEEDHWGKNDDEHHEDSGSEGEEDSN
jgi:hypothetical protein